MNRTEYTALRRAAYEAAVRASDWTIAYADSPSFVQARADDDFRRALDRIPKPKPSAIGTLIARQQNRRLYVLGMLHDRTRRRRMGIPTSQDTYAIRCVLDPTYAAREQADREARALHIGGVQCAS
jgi:hypothetical protein